MKNVRKISISVLAVVLLSAWAFVLPSCKKDSKSGGTPMITGLRAYKASPNDSVLTRVSPSDYVVIQGSNFGGLQAVLFDGFPATINTSLASSNSIVVTVPFNIPFATIDPAKFNTIQVVTSSGTVTYPFTIVAPKPVIGSISNETPFAGDVITLNGSGLLAISSVTFPGSLASPKVTFDPGGGFANVQVPAGYTSQSGPITVVTKYGTTTSIAKLYDPIGVLTNFDDVNQYDASNGTATITNSSADYPGNHGNFARMSFAKMPAYDWGDGGAGRRIILNPVQWVPVANVNDPTSSWALKFEIFAKNPWSAGCIFIHDWNWNRTCRFEPWKSATNTTFQTKGWQTITIPLDQFKSKANGADGTGDPATTVGGLIGSSGKARLGFLLDNATVDVLNFDIAIDNVRIVKIN